MNQFQPQEIKKTISTKLGKVHIFSVRDLEKRFPSIENYPYSIKILLENVLRNFDNYQVTFEDVKRLVSWAPHQQALNEIAFKPSRVLLQDFTGVPCVVDLAAMRSALKRMGGNVNKINPQVPCDLVIDHSIQVDYYGSKKALGLNIKKEFERNQERYQFLKWGQKAFKNFRVIPPATGIIHQVNLEYLAKGVLLKKNGKETIAYPDSVVGTDSHTTMINGIGIVGWGVGGIEAEAVMLGEPIYMLMPEVIGVKLKGKLQEGVTATDLVLTLTQLLRARNVVGKFVEFFGEGIARLSLADRATVANMGPEYGATMGLFPVDQETLNYYKLTGRSAQEVDLIERYYKEQGMFYSPRNSQAQYTDVIELQLETIEPCLAGPKRPQDRVAIKDVKESFLKSLVTPIAQGGFGLDKSLLEKKGKLEGSAETLGQGALVLASITSCTNTSNPAVLISAGLLAKKAVDKGLKVKSFVKTSFAPGSRVVTDYLDKAKLTSSLEALGFHNVGYGCMTCIGNSGPLLENVVKAIKENDLIAVSILSGNRNFEGRINPFTKANYLASPPFVIAYALAGRIDIDFANEPIGVGRKGEAIYLKDIWPKDREVYGLLRKAVSANLFKKRYKNIKGNAEWDKIKIVSSELYPWNAKSTYIQEPPYFEDLKTRKHMISDVKSCRVLVMLGDSITTDHISPAGSISATSPAGQYLQDIGIQPVDFNSYGSRRGNDQVMTRGTFANIRLRNQLVPGSEGTVTIHFPTNQKLSIFEAAQIYKKEGTPLAVLAGKEYGTGSSRDWAAKGVALLGVKVVLAESFERIHRSNLVGMGILPLEFEPGENCQTLDLKGDEIFDFVGLTDALKPRQKIKVIAKNSQSSKEFAAIVRIDTPVEVDYYRHGGILPTVLLKFLNK